MDERNFFAELKCRNDHKRSFAGRGIWAAVSAEIPLRKLAAIMTLSGFNRESSRFSAAVVRNGADRA
jgi:hypothetical protein